MAIHVESNHAGIWTVWLDRPAKRNAMTLEMYRAFAMAFDQLDANDAVRCIIVRGAGGTFCAGSDIGTFGDDRNSSDQAQAYANLTLDCTDRLKLTRHPTVACIEGACVGGGLEIAAMCDIRIAAQSARFGVPVNKIGIVLDHRELDDIIRLIGPAATLEILLEGHIFGADEALRKGLLSEVVADTEVVGRAYKAAERIAAGAPLSNRWHKKFVRQLVEGAALSAQDRQEAYACFNTEDYRIGQMAFLNKQKPTFVGH